MRYVALPCVYEHFVAQRGSHRGAASSVRPAQRHELATQTELESFVDARRPIIELGAGLAERVREPPKRLELGEPFPNEPTSGSSGT